MDRFATTSARRKWLGKRLHKLLEAAKATGYLCHIFIWGSFVTNKESPNDLDILLIMDSEFQLEQITTEHKILLDHSQAKLRFNADIFWAKISIGKTVLELWLDTYQTGRDFKRRGIVEVIFK
ncbi:MAG: hypothetical protein AB1489_39030 [Acidobacteriota bacterium]